MPSPATLVRNQQQAWAWYHDIPVDADGYTLQLDDNFFLPLSSASRAEFQQGDGAELPSPGTRGKMQALHSSSALAVNVFEYWRRNDSSPLSAALAIPDGIETIRFEQKFPTGLSGNPPNLDVVLTSTSGYTTAIECKFLEPYSTHPSSFSPSYFPAGPGLWSSAGFQHCQQLAERLHAGETVFTYLNAEQLLKHILGLNRNAENDWSLLYLWYEVPGTDCEHHGYEAEVFGSIVRDDPISFAAVSYQALFRAIKKHAGATAGEYIAYLGERYFQG